MIAVCGALVCAGITDLAGTHVIFGAFLFGAALAAGAAGGA